MSQKPRCGFCGRVFRPEACDFGKCISEFHKQHHEALKLLDRCVKAIRKAKQDYNMGWNKAIEQRPLSDAADDAASFLLTVKDPAGTLS